MFCRSCGQQMPDQSRFCPKCGAVSEQAAPVQQPAYAAPVYQTPVYAAPAAPVRKKKHIGCLVTVAILVVLLAGAGWFAASLLGWFGPKNLGVEYTETDYQSALAKIGTVVVFEGMSGDELREYTKTLKASGKKYPISDYEWIHSDYQEKSFELTSEEATALINEIAPAFFWFENAQIKIQDNGKVEAAGTLLLAKGLNDLYPDLIDQVPFPVFEKVNLAAGGGIGITENRLALSADSFMTGPVEGISAEMLNDNAEFFEPLYTSVPGLIIHKLEVTSRGTFQVDALIPQRTEVRRIAP